MVKFNNSSSVILNNFQNGDYFKIEEVNPDFIAINPKSKYRYLSINQKLNNLISQRMDNLLNKKPINHGLPDTKEESEAIKDMIGEGESRDRIFYFFQRSETVLHKIIKKTLAGELEDDDPFVLAAQKILDQTK